MGAGKTQFVKGLGKGLGIDEEITSPTYTYELQYPFEAEGHQLTFFHIDAWRASSTEFLQELGIDNALTQQAVCAIEWADKVFDDSLIHIQPKPILVSLTLSYGQKENDRHIHIEEKTA
jgi:tRNA threonylcarbamoyladenosine biosynthesis protein TsaE